MSCRCSRRRSRRKKWRRASARSRPTAANTSCCRSATRAARSSRSIRARARRRSRAAPASWSTRRTRTPPGCLISWLLSREGQQLLVDTALAALLSPRRQAEGRDETALRDQGPESRPRRPGKGRRRDQEEIRRVFRAVVTAELGGLRRLNAAWLYRPAASSTLASRSVGAIIRVARRVSVRARAAAVGMARLVQHHRRERRPEPRQFCAPGDRSDLCRPLPDGARASPRAWPPAHLQWPSPLAWLVARTDLPLRRRDPRARHRILRHPALSRRDRLGNPRRAEQRHPQSMVPRDLRARALRTSVRHLHGRRSGICDGVLQLPLRLRAGGKRSRQYSRPSSRRPRRSSAARGAATLRRVTLPMVLPALLAGALVAFLQALTQFGTPAILALPAGFHVITTKIWALFQYPAEPASRGGRGVAAAAPDDTVAARTAMAARPARLCRHRRQERRAAAGSGSVSGDGRRSPLRWRSSLCRSCFPMRR